MFSDDDLYKNVIFGNGEISVYRTSEINTPVNTLVVMLEGLRNTTIDIDAVLYAIGKKEAEFLHRTFRKSPEMDYVGKLLDFIELCGWGKFELAAGNKETLTYVFSSEHSLLAHQYLKLDVKREKAEAYIVGLLTGMLEQVTGEKLSGEETKCMVSGQAQCVIEVRKGEDELVDLGRVSDSFSYDVDITPQYNQVIEMAITQKLMKISHGRIKLWNFDIVFVPTATFLLLQEYVRKELGEEVVMLFYYAARKQAYAGTQIQIQQYGRKQDKQLYLSMLQHHEFSGLGNASVKVFDEEKKQIDFLSSNNVFLKFYEKLFGEVKECNVFLRGLAAGIAHGYFEVPMECSEIDVESAQCVMHSVAGDSPMPAEIEELANKSLTVGQFLR